MQIIHESKDNYYRQPFGAVPVSSQVTLRAKVEGCAPEAVFLMLWHGEEEQPELIRMKRITQTAEPVYETAVTVPEEPCLLWYDFCLRTEAGPAQEPSVTCASGRRRQITVYRHASIPDWYRNGIIYQIFPDRFSRDEGWRERCDSMIESFASRAGQGRFIEDDWNRPPYYVKDAEGAVTDWPIYGGSLKGIEEKLDYLSSLGVTGIYLNPIFESVSNHHYDTADYMKIDPSLGTEEDFVSLAESAGRRGIRIILDGVFSHTGADSRYFDIYGNYEKEGVKGAFRHPDSKYRSWYSFDENDKCGYKTWWGVRDLPEVNETDPGFNSLINGESGVISCWTQRGASGWRLDVADELPDEFIASVRTRLKETDPDAVLIGEVWEDASNKISYGIRRKYFMGDELDGTMNYPLRQILLDYINYTVSSGTAGELITELMENYPPENFCGALNILGSHDRARILTMMAEAEDRYSAVRKVKLMSALQYALPGVPCIYYGDEAGMTGGEDPDNRGSFPWGREDGELEYHYRMLGLIYREHPVLADGDLKLLSGVFPGINEDVFAFTRGCSDETVLVLANRSYSASEADLRDVFAETPVYALDLMTSEEVRFSGDSDEGMITLEPLSFRLILIKNTRPEKPIKGRSAGVICHISSLGIPKLGAPAREFADYIASAGMKIWQVLPLNPPGLGGSPYSSYSAFAGAPELINYDELPDMSGFGDFCRDNRKWLCEYAAYMLIKEKQGGREWTDWPEEYRTAEPEVYLTSPEADREYADRLVLEQYYFHEQWSALRSYASSVGIELMGDIPMYMSGDSADVWANQSIFLLDEKGRKRAHAGVPPDAFTDEGQNWGNPLYDWKQLKTSGYAWWLRRLGQCAERFDILRIDHFRGLSEYFEIPECGRPADGRWQHGPGLDFLNEAKRYLAALGEEKEGKGLMLFAEDLGVLDAGVGDLLALTGIPGMDVWQFSADEMRAMPSQRAETRAFYTGTHDNSTLVGALLENGGTEEAPDRTEAEIQALRIIREIYESPAALAMLQLQDMFLLDDDARMNIPGVPEGNWRWRIPGASVEAAFPDAELRAEWFRELAERTGRI